jgi:hypothetical protein
MALLLLQRMLLCIDGNWENTLQTQHTCNPHPSCTLSCCPALCCAVMCSVALCFVNIPTVVAVVALVPAVLLYEPGALAAAITLGKDPGACMRV